MLDDIFIIEQSSAMDNKVKSSIGQNRQNDGMSFEDKKKGKNVVVIRRLMIV